MSIFDMMDEADKRATARRHELMAADANRRHAANAAFLGPSEPLKAHRAVAVELLSSARDSTGFHAFDYLQTVELVRAFEEIVDAKIALAMGKPVVAPYEIHVKAEPDNGPFWMTLVKDFLPPSA